MEEYFPLVDETGAVIGKATRRECHSGSFLLHPVVHLHVFDNKGRLYLQKRALNKDIQPGKWDTSVGGHMDPGETVEQALFREAGEELGLSGFNPVFYSSTSIARMWNRSWCTPILPCTMGQSTLIRLKLPKGVFGPRKQLFANWAPGFLLPILKRKWNGCSRQ